MSKCSADETPVCCCMDVGTIMDNSDCTASYSRVFATRAEAEETLAALTEKRVAWSLNLAKLRQPLPRNPKAFVWILILFSPAKQTLIFQLGLR